MSLDELYPAFAARIGDQQALSQCAQVSDPVIDGDRPSREPAEVDGGGSERDDVDDDDIGAADGAIDLTGQLQRMIEVAGRDGHAQLGKARLQTAGGDG